LGSLIFAICSHCALLGDQGRAWIQELGACKSIVMMFVIGTSTRSRVNRQGEAVEFDVAHGPKGFVVSSWIDSTMSCSRLNAPGWQARNVTGPGGIPIKSKPRPRAIPKCRPACNCRMRLCFACGSSRSDIADKPAQPQPPPRPFTFSPCRLKATGISRRSATWTFIIWLLSIRVLCIPLLLSTRHSRGVLSLIFRGG
jgi:hypothetical protein